MRQESNREMDILLRRLARRGDGGASAESERTDHLDADELNAYAENVVPAAARARYTEHLAECARCRELIVQLSSAAGGVTAVQAVKVYEPSVLRKFLASLFSPMVLRYAAPALGLIIVTAIGVFVLRQRGREAQLNSDVAQQTRLEAPAANQPGSGASAPQSSPDVNYSVDQRGLLEKQEKNDRAQPVTAAPPAPNMPPGVSINAEIKTEQPARSEEADRVAREALAKATPTPADDTAKRVEQEVAQREQTKKEEAEKQKANAEPVPAKEPAADKPVVTESKVDAAQSNARSVRRRGRGDFSIGAAQAGAAPASAAGKDSSEDRDRKGETETRTVAGREFRKRSGVWIDTAYDSSKGAITLTRGSEQYRALIADEPQIKTIADGLDGEIIVVWKGRAYRIR